MHFITQIIRLHKQILNDLHYFEKCTWELSTCKTNRLTRCWPTYDDSNATYDLNRTVVQIKILLHHSQMSRKMSFWVFNYEYVMANNIILLYYQGCIGHDNRYWDEVNKEPILNVSLYMNVMSDFFFWLHYGKFDIAFFFCMILLTTKLYCQKHTNNEWNYSIVDLMNDYYWSKCVLFRRSDVNIFQRFLAKSVRNIYADSIIRLIRTKCVFVDWHNVITSLQSKKANNSLS